MPEARRFSPERSSSRLRHARRVGAPEALENRYLLSATVYTVDALTDTGVGSGTAGDLPYVIGQADANPNPDGSLIQFKPSVFATPRTITVSSPLSLIGAAGPVVISGPGANLLTIDGNHAVEVFSVANGVTATLDGLTIADGWGFDGGGIANGGTISIVDSTLARDSASLGGALANNGGMVTIDGSTLAGDSASLGGGILNNSGTVTVDGSTLSGDLASYGGGGIYNGGTLDISKSTLTGDSSAAGGAIQNRQGTLAVVDSTIAGNTAQYGGGIDMVVGKLSAVNDTVAYNTATSNGSGGGLDLQGGMATLDNTIVALNIRQTFLGPTPDDISRAGGVVLPASADNLIGTGGSGGLTAFADNQVDVASPGLGILGYYGGPTETIPLVPSSPGIGGGGTALAVDPTTGEPLSFDQRGTGFDRIVDGTVDIGAVETLPTASDQVSAAWGTAATASLQTAADGLHLLPQGRTTDVPWSGLRQFEITLGQPEALTAADVTLNSAIGANYGPVTISGSGMSYVITLAQPIDAADRLTITIVNPGVSIFNRQVDVLPGDVNDDGVVNSQDVTAFRNQWLHGDHDYSVFDDINGDGMLDVADLALIRAAVGKSLPPSGSSVGDGATSRGGSGSGSAVAPVGTSSGSAAIARPAGGVATSTSSPFLARTAVLGRAGGLGQAAQSTAINGSKDVGS